MINPYYCYAASFTFALITYAIPWSGLYPPLSLGIVGFLVATIALHLFAGRYMQTRADIRFERVSPGAPVVVTSFIYLLWAAEFIYEGGVPLFKILFNQPYNYRTFGIPSLHVFVVTFSSFYTLYLFQIYCSSRSRTIFVVFLLNLVSALLIYSRAMLGFNLLGCAFIYFARFPFTLTKALILASSLPVLLFFFGMLGSLRESRESDSPYSNEPFMNLGKASAAFRESIVPGEYFWAYIYATSPLANLQTNVSKTTTPELSLRNAVSLVANELMPDFISKRINSLAGWSVPAESRIPGPFNVSTVYSRSYNYLGWPGVMILGFAALLIPIIYSLVIRPSSLFFLSGWVILCTMYTFMVYDNTIRFTGLSLQLAYPILLHFFYNKSRFLRFLFKGDANP